MKRLFTVIILMLLMSIVFLIMSGSGVSYQNAEGMTEISPFSKGLSRLTRLYFIHENQLVSENRTIVIEKLETELSTVQELKKGSRVDIYYAPINQDVEIISVKTSDRICYVSLSEEFMIENEEQFSLNVMSIVNTLTELDAVDYVQILIDGKRVDRDSEVKLSEPIARNTAMVQSKELTHKDIVKKFLEYISTGRYYLAYDMIDSRSKQYVNFDDFRESMVVIRNDIKGHAQKYIFASRENGQYVIQVKYVIREFANTEDVILNSESPREFSFAWPVVQEKGIWKILFYNE